MKRAWILVALSLGLGGPLFGACEPSSAGKLPAAGPDAVAVTIETDPPGSTVLVDGSPVGKAPVTVMVNPGNHRLKATRSGYFANDQKLTVAKGDAPKTMRLTLVASH